MQEGVEGSLRAAAGAPESSGQEQEGTFWKKSIFGGVEQCVNYDCRDSTDNQCNDVSDPFFPLHIRVRLLR